MRSIQYVAYGLAADMIAEVSAFDYNACCGTKHRYYVMPVGELQYDTEACDNLKEAKLLAREIANALNCGIYRV
jgi:hypothetical protein